MSFGELWGESRDQSRDEKDVSQTYRQTHVDSRHDSRKAKDRGVGGDSGSLEREREIIRTPVQFCRPEGGGLRERERERETERARARQAASPPPPPRNLHAVMPIAGQVTVEVPGPSTRRAASPPPPPRNLRSLMPVPRIVRQGTVYPKVLSYSIQESAPSFSSR